jgi:hypothetical protein
VSDRWCDVGESPLQPPIERWHPVIEQAEPVEDFDGVVDAETAGSHGGEHLAVSDAVALDVLGQQDYQGAVHVAGHPLGPSAGFADLSGGVLAPEQPRVGEVAVPDRGRSE